MSLLDESNQLEELFDCPAAEALGDLSRSPCHPCEMPFAALLPWAWPYPTSKGFLLQRKSLSVQRHAEGFLQEAGPFSPALCGWEQDVMEGLLSLRPHPAWKGCRGERQGSLESIWGQPWQEVQM